MKARCLIAALLIAAFLASCSSEPETDAETRFNDQSSRDLSYITPQFINQLDQEIADYLDALDDPEKQAYADNLRQRLSTKATAYFTGLTQALMGGNPTQQMLAARALGILTDPAAMKITVPMFVERVDPAKSDADLRYNTLIGLSLMGRALRSYEDRDSLLYSIALNLNHDKDIEFPWIREVAAEALGKAMKAGEKPQFLEALVLRLSEEPEWEVKRWVIYALYEVGDVRGLEAIVAQCLHDENPEIRLESVVALGNALNMRFLGDILGMIDDESASVRRQTIGMLIKFRKFDNKKHEISEAIQELLKDNESKVRAQAADALGFLGDTSAVTSLLSKLGDRELSVRIAAVRSLGMLHDKRAIEPLIKTMASREEELKERCLATLEIITGVDFGTDPSLWQQWYDAGMPPVAPEHRSKRFENIDDDDNAPQTKPE